MVSIMTSHTDSIVEFEDSSDSTNSPRKIGFFARRRNRRKVRKRAKELEERIERPESGKERHPRRRELSSLARSQSISLQQAATGSQSPDLVGNGPRRVDLKARNELRVIRGRREFLRQSAVGAGILALGASLGYGSGYAHATGLSGNTRTVITDTEVAARVIGGVRIATEFIPDPVPAGTDADPYPGSAIQAALNDGLHIYIPSGTWRLASTISRAADGVAIVGAGRSTKLVFNGASPCIAAGSRSGWLVTNLATDAGGVDVFSASESRMSEIWINGILTDNRPIGRAGVGGGAYGVRAEDYIVSGDGSPASPYNASAIQNAINALSSRGGIVFVKAGVYAGNTRIRVDAARRVIIIGEGAPMYYADDDGGAGAPTHTGTHIRAGFDCYRPTSFYHITLSPRPGFESTEPALKVILDPLVNTDLHRWLGGFVMEDVEISGGNPGVHMTGVNMLQWPDNWQIWKIVWERVHFQECVTGLKVDKGDAIAASGFVGVFRNLEFRWCSGKAIDIQVESWSGEMSNVLVEGCGAGQVYAVYINVYGTGGLVLQNWNMGDGNSSTKDAFIAIRRGGVVENFTFVKDVDISGGGFYRVGRAHGTGVMNFDAGTDTVYLETMPGHAFAIGTIAIPGTVKRYTYTNW